MTYYFWCICSSEQRIQASRLKEAGHTVIDTSKNLTMRHKALKLGLTRRNRLISE